MLKRFIVFFLALITCLTMVSVANAQETSKVIYENENFVVMLGNPNDPDAALSSTALALANQTSYESVWLNDSAQGSFPIYTDNTGTFGITVKVESSSSDSWAYCTVADPDNNPCKGFNGFYVDPNTNNGDGWYGHVYNATGGTYKISYQAYTTVGMRIMCWIY